MDRVVDLPALKNCVFVDLEALACIRGCLTRFVQGRVGNPGFMALPLEAGGADVAISGGPVEGLYSTALRIEGRSPTAAQGGLLLVSPESGALQALLLDDGYLADLGRALAAAAGLSITRPEGPIQLFVYGAEPAALLYAQALQLVREVPSVVLWDETTDRAEALAATFVEAGFSATVSAAPETVPGDVLVALGSAPPAACLQPGSTVVARPQEPWSEAALEKLGLGFADDPGRSLLGATLALGNLTETKHPPAPDRDAVTLIELTDHPMLDTALGFLAWRKSQKYKLGTILPPADA